MAPLFLVFAALVACLALWFPSAALGVVLVRAFGHNTYLTAGGLLGPAVAGMALLVLALAGIWASAKKLGWRRAGAVAGGIIITWQVAWSVVAVVTGEGQLLAWPYYAEPAEPEPWNPTAVFVTGFSAVAAISFVLTLLAAFRGRPARGGLDTPHSVGNGTRPADPSEADRTNISRIVGVVTACLLALVIVAPVSGSHNQYNPIRKWAVRNVSPYTHYIPVCPPWESAAWNLASATHARVNDAMSEWNEGGGELYFYRTNTGCSTMDGSDTPHVEVTWDSATSFDISVPGQMQPCYDKGLSDIFCNFMENPPVLYRATIMLDSDQAAIYYWGSGSPPSNRHDVESVLLHELGHTLMVMHWSGGGCSPGNNLVMCAFIALGQERDEVWPGYVHDQYNYWDIYGSTH
ncbi:MAG: hypothetical protein ACRDHD_03225 [Candidatus Limnocylindria bacterium]